MNKKRQKTTRQRGSHTHGRGFKKKARGKGHRGGVGLAGTGKRADQKKTKILNLFGNNYFGKAKTLRRKVSKKLKTINLRDIKAKDNKINLKGYKILGIGEINEKIVITASAASESAKEKVKKAGGEIILK
ncbi:50S ribosomal protein L15 [Candidatus Woesearchaeota archaeon]|nr:MAG: 50S ribosomal protein L15 [Candidatus Woesearchaeota archaeon]